MKKLTIFSQKLLTVISFILILFFLLIIPNTNPPHNFPDDIQPVQIQKKLFPAAKDKMIDMGFPPTTGSPLEITLTPRNLNTIQLENSLNYLHLPFLEKLNAQHQIDTMQKLLILFMQFESISRLRFNRGTGRLLSQSDLEDLAEHIMNSSWYRQSLLK